MKKEMGMDELESLIAGDLIGADDLIGAVSRDDLALARALVNSGIAGDVDIVGDDLDDVGAEIDIVGAAPAAPARPKRTVTTGQLRSAIQRNAMKMAGQIVGQRPQGQAPVAMEKKVEGSETETAYLSVYRDATNGGPVAAGAEVDVVG